jgi:hypothetical protein
VGHALTSVSNGTRHPETGSLKLLEGAIDASSNVAQPAVEFSTVWILFSKEK